MANTGSSPVISPRSAQAQTFINVWIVTLTFTCAAPHRGCVCLRTDGAVALCFNHKADTGSVRRKRARFAQLTRKASHTMIYVMISRDVDDTRGPEAVPGIIAMISTSGS